jgi:hypothetical protein
VLAQATGVFAVFVYAGGFLALSLHHASYGISQFNLLRPKIISAGVLFFVFAALPAIETMQIFGFHTANTKKLESDNAPAPAKSYVRWINLLGFLLIALVGSSLVVRPFLTDLPFEGSLYSWAFAAIVPPAAILAAIPLFLMQKRKWELPVCIVLFAMIVVWMAFCVYRTRDITFIVLVGWFLFCSYISYQAYGAINEPQKLQSVNWVQAVTLTMSTAIFFGVQVYPRIPSGFGGGTPTQVTLQFVDKAPFDGAAKSGVWLIDETDVGFYVIRSKDAKKAIFLPRNTIATVYFGEEPEQLKVEPPRALEKPQQQNSPPAKPSN